MVSDGRGCLQWGCPACAAYVRLTPTARRSVRKPASADPTLHARRHGATVLPARNGPSRPPHWCAWDAFCKNDTLLKDGKGRKLRAGWHERNVERDQFGSCTGLDGPNPSAWRVRGKTRWAAGGGVRRSGPHELRWGGAVARALRDHPDSGAQSCVSRAASTPACDAFGGHGEKARRRASSQGVVRGSKRQRSM